MKLTCQFCQNEHETDVSPETFALMPSLAEQFACDECNSARIETETALADVESKKRHRDALERKWSALEPPAMLWPSDLARLNPAMVRVFENWNPSGTEGLAFLGTPGTGKTRCAWLALRKAHDAGLTVAHFRHVDFWKTTASAARGDEKSLAKLDAYATAQVLLIDDIGKARGTELADGELFGLIDDRTSRGRPTIWTANGSLDAIGARFRTDLGEPIIRRLAEFSVVVKV